MSMYEHFAVWTQDGGFYSYVQGTSNLGNDDNIEVPVSCEVSFERGELVSAGAVIARQHNKAIPIETFRIVMNNIGITIPRPEVPRWWYRSYRGDWSEAKDESTYLFMDNGGWACRVFAKGSEREEAANAIREAVTKVIGK